MEPPCRVLLHDEEAGCRRAGGAARDAAERLGSPPRIPLGAVSIEAIGHVLHNLLLAGREGAPPDLDRDLDCDPRTRAGLG